MVMHPGQPTDAPNCFTIFLVMYSLRAMGSSVAVGAEGTCGTGMAMSPIGNSPMACSRPGSFLRFQGVPLTAKSFSPSHCSASSRRLTDRHIVTTSPSPMIVSPVRGLMPSQIPSFHLVSSLAAGPDFLCGRYSTSSPKAASLPWKARRLSRCSAVAPSVPRWKLERSHPACLTSQVMAAHSRGSFLAASLSVESLRVRTSPWTLAFALSTAPLD